MNKPPVIPSESLALSEVESVEGYRCDELEGDITGFFDSAALRSE
jgi:hypothetical protein